MQNTHTTKAENYKLYPVNSAQNWLFKFFDPPYEWYDRLSFGFYRDISKKEIGKAISLLVERHDGLRTTFSNASNRWKQVIHNKIENFDDIINFGEEVSEKAGLAICQQFDIAKLPLFKILVTKKSNVTRFVIFFHHIIIDYIGVMIFFREFCELLRNNTLIPLISSNAQFAENFNDANQLVDTKKDSNYWSSSLRGFKRGLRKPCLEIHAKVMQRNLPEEFYQTILRFGKKHLNVSSLHTVLAAPLYKTMAMVNGNKRVAISHKLHGRNIESSTSCFFSVLGNFAINVPVVEEVDVNSNWLNIVQSLENRFSELPMNGLTYDILQPQPYPDHFLTTVRFNYMGILSFPVPKDIEVNFKTFARRVSHPNQPLTTFVEFFLYFVEKILVIEVAYDPLAIEPKWVEEVVDKYVGSLQNLVNYIKDRSTSKIQLGSV